MTTISVIIPCHNNSFYLRLVLLALINQSSLAEEIICVDDSSSPDELKWIKNLCNKYKAQLIQLPPNKMIFGRRSLARNYGSRVAKGDVCLYLDGDMILGSDYIKTIRFLHSTNLNIMVKGVRYTLDKYDQDRGIRHCLETVKHNVKKQKVVHDIYRISPAKNINQALLGSSSPLLLPLHAQSRNAHVSRRMFLRNGTSFAFTALIGKYFGLYSNKSSEYRWDYCASNNLSVRTTHVKKIGYWDERFIGWGEEDMDFAYRLFAHGIEPVLPEAGSVYAYHLDHDIDMETNIYTLEQNANHFVRKNPIMRELRGNVYSKYGIEI